MSLRILNVYATNNIASKYIKQELTENKVEISFNRNLCDFVYKKTKHL